MKTLKKLFSKKLTWGVIIIVFLASIGGYYYYANFYLPTGQSEESTLQTATVRQGDLVIYASGSCTLVAATEASFGFGSSGQVKNLYAKVGNVVSTDPVNPV
jgi:multidrug efflux pump subunit AcrA (membrane-fusion protein)